MFQTVASPMMRSLPELHKPVWYSEDSVQIWGIQLDTMQAESLQGCGTANPLVCM